MNLPSLSESSNPFSKSPHTISILQQDVLAVLRVIYGLDRVLSENVFDQNLNLSSDIFVPHLNLAIEVDGPDHFVGSSCLPTGKTLFRTGLQQDYGLRTISLDHRHWSRLSGLSSKVGYITNRISAVIN